MQLDRLLAHHKNASLAYILVFQFTYKIWWWLKYAATSVQSLQTLLLRRQKWIRLELNLKLETFFPAKLHIWSWFMLSQQLESLLFEFVTHGKLVNHISTDYWLKSMLSFHKRMHTNNNGTTDWTLGYCDVLYCDAVQQISIYFNLF